MPARNYLSAQPLASASCDMTTVPRNGDARATARKHRTPAAAAVLADRLAATLVHHEPGWRLPRLTALARRYNVSPSEIDAAIGDLAARHLVRRLPDGQVYRASPAEYWVPLEGISGLVSRVDPIGGQLACARTHTAMRRPSEDIGRALGVAPGDRVLNIRSTWTVGGQPAALAASYLPEQIAAKLGAIPVTKPAGDAAPDLPEQADPVSPLVLPIPWQPADTPSPRPAAAQIEMCLPPPSAARKLRAAAGQPVLTVTQSFTEPACATAAALTVAMLRSELFRIVVEAASPHALTAGFIDNFAGDWGD